MGAATHDYALLADQLAELSRAAQAGDIDGVVALQAAHDTLIARIKSGGSGLRKHPDAPRIARLISDALTSIQSATPHLRALRDRTQDDAAGTRLHRQVSRSYR